MTTQERAIHERNSLHQAQVTKLTEMMFNMSSLQAKDQQQSFRPLINSIVD